MDHLPVELVLKVCSYLSFTSLVKLEGVCRGWRKAVEEVIYKNPDIRIKLNVTTETCYDAGDRLINDLAVCFCLKSDQGLFNKTKIVSKNFHPFRLILVDRYIVSRMQGKLQVHTYVHSSELFYTDCLAYW